MSRHSAGDGGTVQASSIASAINLPFVLGNDVHIADRPSIQLSPGGSVVNAIFGVRRGARAARIGHELPVFRRPIGRLGSRLQAKRRPEAALRDKQRTRSGRKSPAHRGSAWGEERAHVRRDGRARSRKLKKSPHMMRSSPGQLGAFRGDWLVQRAGCINILHDSAPSIG
jgi:hypothetical protein